MYKFLIVFHIISSTVFIGIAISLTMRSILGWVKNLKYSHIDRVLAYIFIFLLYLTLIHGIILYFFINPDTKIAGDIQHALKQASLRFWVVEHFYVMTFALLLSQIGGIFIKKTTTDKNRFMYASFYYGIATLITLISLIFYFIYR